MTYPDGAVEIVTTTAAVTTGSAGDPATVDCERHRSTLCRMRPRSRTLHRAGYTGRHRTEAPD
jgi:hypothetical protein